MSESIRKLARIARIDALRPIPAADAIEAAFIGGWPVVVKKGEYQVGDLCIYFEIDSFLPEGNPNWQFLVDKSSREFENRRGHVLRAIKLRGQLSQGLLLPLSALKGTALEGSEPTEGMLVTEALGVLKYEPPIPAELAGQARGLFPSLFPKTDQERIQNLAAELAEWQLAGAAGELTWEITEKLEGSSCTFANMDDGLHVCSRNIDLVDTPGNSFWAQAHALEIGAKLKSIFGSTPVALQGELIGNGIQDNIYGLRGHKFYLFDVYNAKECRKLTATERQDLAREMGIDHSPVIDSNFVIDGSVTMESLLAMADGDSALKKGQLREGYVFKALQRQVSFKVVSNRYLLKQKAR